MHTRTLMFMVLSCGMLANAKFKHDPQTMFSNMIREHEELMEQMAEFERKMFDEEQLSPSKGMPKFTDSASLYDQVTFKEHDGTLEMQVRLPQGSKIDLSHKGVTADVDKEAAEVTITHETGEIELYVQPEFARVAMQQQHTEQSNDEEAQKEDKQKHMFTSSYTTRSTLALPVRVDPATLKQNGSYRVTYDDERNVMTLKFDTHKRAEPINLQIQRQSEQEEDAAEQETPVK